MNLYISDIKNYVKTCLDEMSNTSDAALLSNDQTSEELDTIIVNAIVPAVRKIHLDAPNVLLKEGKTIDSHLTPIPLVISESSVVVTPQRVEFSSKGGTKNVTVRTAESYSIETAEDTPSSDVEFKYHMYEQSLPKDFMRLVSLKMVDWDRPIQTLVNEDSAEYHKQRNKYLMGTPRRPIGALVRRDGGATMELYSCSSNSASLDYGTYIPEPALPVPIIDNSSIWIAGDAMRYPCLNQITANVLRSLGEFQKAALYESMAVQPFYIDPDYARLNPVNSERINSINNQ